MISNVFSWFFLYTCRTIHQMWSGNFNSFLSNHFQSLNNLHQFEKDTILGKPLSKPFSTIMIIMCSHLTWCIYIRRKSNVTPKWNSRLWGNWSRADEPCYSSWALVNRYLLRVFDFHYTDVIYTTVVYRPCQECLLCTVQGICLNHKLQMKFTRLFLLGSHTLIRGGYVSSSISLFTFIIRVILVTTTTRILYI